MNDAEQGYRKLRAWQKADDLASAVYHLFNGSTKAPRWLATQALRAVVSVPANIAEGYSRRSRKEYVHFLDIARGSLAEVEYYIHFMDRNGIAEHTKLATIDSIRRETATLLFALISSLRRNSRAGGKVLTRDP